MFKNIPPITRNLLFINIILFMVQQVISMRYGDVLTELFGLHFVLAPDFRIYQPLTYMFLHASWSHVLLNMFSLWMFGRIIEQTMGQKRFIIYYLVCGIGAAFCQELWQFGEYYLTGMAKYDAANVNGMIVSMSSYLNQWVTIGASGACYGVLLAFGMTFPNERIMLLIPPIPMKAKYFVIGYAAIEAYSAFTSNGNVAHFAHLGGMFFGWLIFRYWRKQTERRQAGFQGWNNYRGTQQAEDTTPIAEVISKTREVFSNKSVSLSRNSEPLSKTSSKIYSLLVPPLNNSVKAATTPTELHIKIPLIPTKPTMHSDVHNKRAWMKS